MSNWTHQIAEAEAAAQRIQAEEDAAERRFDAVHAKAQAAGTLPQIFKTEEFRAWMTARRETDAAWGAWSMVMDAKPA